MCDLSALALATGTAFACCWSSIVIVLLMLLFLVIGPFRWWTFTRILSFMIDPKVNQNDWAKIVDSQMIRPVLSRLKRKDIGDSSRVTRVENEVATPLSLDESQRALTSLCILLHWVFEQKVSWMPKGRRGISKRLWFFWIDSIKSTQVHNCYSARIFCLDKHGFAFRAFEHGALITYRLSDQMLRQFDLVDPLRQLLRKCGGSNQTPSLTPDFSQHLKLVDFASVQDWENQFLSVK